MKNIDIIQKMVLGTAQFGMNYGITNTIGKPTKAEVFDILDVAWENGIRRFDTAPGYGSEALLGEFILFNGIQDEAIVLTKIPSLDGLSDYETIIIKSTELSLKNLGCAIDVLFFHNPNDSILLLKAPEFFDGLLHDYPISSLGVSVYEPDDVEKLLGCPLELAFQFPLNVLDRRFEQVSMPKNKRYARSVFLQGLLASINIPKDAPIELLNLQKEYHYRLAKHNLEPIGFAISFTSRNDSVDYFVVGVDSEKQLKEILDLESIQQKEASILDTLRVNIAEKWLDPRQWN